MRRQPCPGCGAPLPADPDRGCACGLCRVCGWREAVVHGRCRTDYMYRRRHGEDRPERLVIRHAERLTHCL